MSINSLIIDKLFRIYQLKKSIMSKTRCQFLIFSLIFMCISSYTRAQQAESYNDYIPIIKNYLNDNYKDMFREPKGELKYSFIVPGSSQYENVLWDWDSWWSNVAIRQILQENGSKEEREEALKYEKGCILNFLEFGGGDGWIPFQIKPGASSRSKQIQALKEDFGSQFNSNMHKPCLAQHAAFIIQQDGENAEWLREKFYYMQSFINAYRNYYYNSKVGLYVFANDKGTGTDNDPTQYYRPPFSTATPYQNSLMYKELQAMAYIAKQLNLGEIATDFENQASHLKAAMQTHMWDDVFEYYFSLDFNLLPNDRGSNHNKLHIGGPRAYDYIPIKLLTWTGFCTMWANVATPEQAKLMVEKHYRDTTNLKSPYGIRTLSKKEKMYFVGASGNPSSWLGPIWIISNYMTFRGLINYGYETEAEEMAKETILLLGRDIKKNGGMHEYYLPSNGEPVLNLGFLNWNCLVMNMIAYLEGGKVIEEF